MRLLSFYSINFINIVSFGFNFLGARNMNFGMFNLNISTNFETFMLSSKPVLHAALIILRVLYYEFDIMVCMFLQYKKYFLFRCIEFCIVFVGNKKEKLMHFLSQAFLAIYVWMFLIKVSLDCSTNLTITFDLKQFAFREKVFFHK